jgi:hypothetical protein
MRYAVQLLITTPVSKGKSVQYFSHRQALSGLSFMKLTSVDQMFRFRKKTKWDAIGSESEWWTNHRQEKRPREMFRKGGDKTLKDYLRIFGPAAFLTIIGFICNLPPPNR